MIYVAKVKCKVLVTGWMKSMGGGEEGQNVNRIQCFKFKSLHYWQKFRRVTLWGKRDSMSRWTLKIYNLLCEQVIKVGDLSRKLETNLELRGV